MAVQAQGKLPMYLIYMLGCALVVLGSVLYKEELFAASVEVVEHHPKHAIVNMHMDEEYRRDVDELRERHKAGSHKAEVSEEDLEDDQYLGEFEDDDDGSYAEEWQDQIDNTELYPDDDDELYPDGMDIEEENERDPKWIGRDGVMDDDEWLGEDPEDEIDPDYTDMDLFDDAWDDTLGLGPGGEEIAEQKLEEESVEEGKATAAEGGDDAAPATAEETSGDDSGGGEGEGEGGGGGGGEKKKKKKMSRRMLSA